MTSTVDVLVVGAGPAGLTTALQARAHGASVRVVERRPAAFRPSRAMIVHPRTLESLRPLGVVDALLDRADRAPGARLHLGEREVAARLADVALADTAYPHLTMVRQMEVETVLAEAAVARGIDVERGVELVDVVDDGDRVRSRVRSHGRTARIGSRFVAGCDGPDSTVRRAAGIGFDGAAYREEIVLADLELDGDLAPGVLHVVASGPGLVFLFALGEGATWRLLATRPARDPVGAFGQPAEAVPVGEVQAILDTTGLGLTVRELPWSGRVRLQHRLARTFRQGRLFLAGDAAHTHSPAAAQGMNSGMLDAANLGWKLALAPGAADEEVLLRSYPLERRPVARQVLALTHLVFFAEASTHPLPSLLRGRLVPLAAPVVPLLLRQRRPVALVVRLLSQGWVAHRGSPLSVDGGGRGPGPRPGHRLPDERVMAAGREVRLHDLTARPGVHLLVAAGGHLAPELVGPQVTAHRIDSWPGRGVLAARPDGYVGYRAGDVAAPGLRDWLARVGAL